MLLFEAQTLSTDGSEELLSVSHLTGVGPRSEKNVTMTEAESLEGYRVVEQGDLVINTMWAWMGALGVARHAGIVSPAYGVYRPRPAAPFEPRFFDYLYRSTEYVMEMTRISRGIWSSRLRLYPEVFLRMAVPVPPLEEQRAIADYLDRETARIDTLIEEQQRLIVMLRERREAVIGAAFLDAQAQQPLKRVVRDVTVGIVVQPSRWYVEDGVPALRGLNINRGSVSTRDLVYISAEGDAANPKSRLNGGDVVVVRTGQAGAAAKVPESLDGANAIDILIIRPGTGTDADFLVWYLNSPVAASHIDEGSVGALQGHFNVGALRELPFPTISLDSQRRIAIDLDTKVSAIDALIAETERFIELSRERRAALITAAVTGQIDVRGAV
ncbi:restriction endonuclease subunit S [Sphaerisporangium album]|uniref:Restriction endonuclease subunit S n=1 Tax=Sphaerisporangium album TaxID=509200 RepID=A0A367FI06_9ACTN|nr:restriction endonuclease subunit S [Sphaerisporangium album]RCG29462.1 restriction endonuclease subunit S [Sphaerisporangium album]